MTINQCKRLQYLRDIKICERKLENYKDDLDLKMFYMNAIEGFKTKLKKLKK